MASFKSNMILISAVDYELWYFVFIFQYSEVFSQVCVETKLDYRDVPETYQYTYMEAYEKSNCLFWCTDTRVATAVGTRSVRKLLPEQINVCCEGYIQDENYNGNSIHCKPQCTPPCMNGYCKSPGVCACNPGYLPDMFDSYNCSPFCIKGCNHGTCIAPNTCQCDLGYNLVDEVCEPICSEPCHNGSCVAPETCQCLPGYKKSENETCEPYCSSYTVSGECINTITCELGWTKVTKGLIEFCVAECHEPCTNGFCIAPDTCECLNGYEKTINGTCEPYCTGCVHGSCISPQVCVCDAGWYKRESSGTCLAHCDYSCGNGTCVAPNVCECFPGYELDELKPLEARNTPLCVPFCKNCEGSCVAPGKCECEPPREIMLVTNDGKPCDCMDDCSDGATKCERTVCLLTTTTASITLYDSVGAVGQATTVPTDVPSTTDFQYDTSFNNSNIHTKPNIGKASWLNANWIYTVGSTIILLTIILTATAILKKKYTKASCKNIANANDNKSSLASVVHYKQNSN